MKKTQEISPKKRTLIFINLLISCIASSMLATAMTTALPKIMIDFDVSISTGQWITSGYSLAMGIMMPLTAFLITRFSTKKLYLSAIGIFTIGLIVSVISPNFTVMMVGRVLQASGNGIVTSMAQVILLTIYPPEQRGSIMGWYGLSIGTAPVIAPALAGFLVDNFSWKMIFYIAIAIMIISLIWAITVFDDVLNTQNNKFDIISFILSIFGFGGITLGIGNISNGVNLSSVLPLIIGLVGMIFFVMRQLKLENPFLELRILKHKDYTLSVIGSMLLYLVMMGSSVIMPLYVQSIMGYSATMSGLVTMPGSLAMAIISPMAGKIYDKLGIKKLFIFGVFAMLLSNLGMILITMETSIWIASMFNVVRCIAIGCLMMPLVTWGVSNIKTEHTAHGTALLTSLRTISGAIGSAVFVGIMNVVADNSIDKYGENSMIHGLNITFAFMSIFTLILLLVSIFGVKNNEKS